MTGAVLAASFQAGRTLDPRPSGWIRYSLLAGIGALGAYDYAALALPGSAVFRSDGGLWWLALMIVACGGIGVLVARWWQQGRPGR
jgi:hypothetical protein